MKKLLSIILCITTIFSLSGCMTKQQKVLKEQYEKEAVPIAVKYIEEKYGFTPKVSYSVGMTEYDGTFYTNATKNIRVVMKHNGKEFTTLLAGEENSLCYDNYEYDLISKDLKDYFKERIKADFEMDIAYGYLSNNELFKNASVINQKYNGDLWSVLENEQEDSMLYITIKMSEPNSNLSNISEVTLKELIDLNTELRLHIINLKDKKYINKFNNDEYLYETYSRSPSIGLYATELIEYDEELYYEKYTTNKTKDFIYVYSNNATTEIDEDFSANKLSEQVREKLYDRKIASSKLSIHFDGTSKKNRLYIFSKLPMSTLNKTTKTNDYKYFFNYSYNNEHLFDFDGKHVDGYAADVVFTRENNIDFFFTKLQRND